MRKLATVRRISDIKPINGADKIELAIIDGWQVVVKKGEFSVGEMVVYLEIDSWVPTKIAPFLTKDGHFPKVYEGVEGERLKTVKLRGEISQGLILPLDIVISEYNSSIHSYDSTEYPDEGYDVTELLGILKWEKPLPTQLSGLAKGNFPSLVPKTDQERIQNLSRSLEEWKEKGYTFEVTEKLEGSSMTCYLSLDGEFEVCSRNLSLKESDSNAFWIAARKYNIEEKMRSMELFGFALQGELIGEGIQGNIYGVQGYDFYVFDIYDVNKRKYLPSGFYGGEMSRFALVDSLELKNVPWMTATKLYEDTVQSLLDIAKGMSTINPKKQREGLVFKCIEDTSISFKAINNDYLLKNNM